MRLCILELPTCFGDVEGQLERVDAALAASEAGDVVVLPELALTGYVSPDGDFDLSAFAEALTGPTAVRLSQLAAHRQITLCAPLIERADDVNTFNTLCVFGQDGQLLARYRKRNPWYPETWATPGNLGHPVVTLGGVRFTFAVCFDLHFVTGDLPEADWLVFPSAWVEEDAIEQRQALLQTLARTRNMGVINANWGRGLPRIETQGRSLIISRDGQLLAETSRQRKPPPWLTYPL